MISIYYPTLYTQEINDMPLKKCTVDGKAGYQWGNEGKCYTGPGAKKKAIRQGVAVEGPKKFSQIAQTEATIFSKEDIEAVASFMYEEGYSNTSIVATIAALPSHDASSKTKKEWDKTNKKELKRDTKKEQKEHEKDAIKDDKEKIKKLKKDPPSEKKKREIKDLEKDKRYDKRDAKAIYEGDRTTSIYVGDREGYGHFHTLTKGATQTSKARTRFGDLIITGHFHEIVDGKIMPADGHTHTIKDIGPGEGWVFQG